MGNSTEVSTSVAAWIVGLAGFMGAVLGSVVRPLMDFLMGTKKQQTEWKREALKQQLEELYRPLYENYVIMPKEDPEHYFCDMGVSRVRYANLIALQKCSILEQ